MSSVVSQQVADEEVAYTEFVFRVYPDGRRRRFTQVYINDTDGEAKPLLSAPRGAVAETALAAVVEVQQEMRRRR